MMKRTSGLPGRMSTSGWPEGTWGEGDAEGEEETEEAISVVVVVAASGGGVVVVAGEGSATGVVVGSCSGGSMVDEGRAVVHEREKRREREGLESCWWWLGAGKPAAGVSRASSLGDMAYVDHTQNPQMGGLLRSMPA